MPSVVYQPDHLGLALSRLAEQYKRTTGIVGILTALCAQIQDLEDALNDLLTARILDGQGVQLDLVGKYLIEPRDGASDDDYKTRLQAKIKVIRSSGTIPNVVKVFNLLLPGNKVIATEDSEAHLVLDVGQITTSLLAVYERFFSEAKSAAVRGDVHYWLSPDDEIFSCDHGDSLTAQVNPTGAQASLAAGSFGTFRFNQYDLAVLSPGEATGECVLVTTPESAGTGISFSPAAASTHPVRARVSNAAAAGAFADLSAGVLAGATVIALETGYPFVAAGHPFKVDDLVTFEPLTSRQEFRTVTAADATSITVAALSNNHAAGSFVAPTSLQGVGNLSDPSRGGKLSGIRTV